MVPTLLAVGFVIGRRWIVPLGTIAWPSLLLLDGTTSGYVAVIVGGGAVGFANTAVGLLVRLALNRAVWRLRPFR